MLNAELSLLRTPRLGKKILCKDPLFGGSALIEMKANRALFAELDRRFLIKPYRFRTIN